MNYTVYTETERQIEFQTDKTTKKKNNLSRQGHKIKSCLISLTIGAALETGPSDWCPLQVSLDTRLQAHVLLLHGVKSITYGVHYLHHVDLAV